MSIWKKKCLHDTQALENSILLYLWMFLVMKNISLSLYLSILDVLDYNSF